MGFPAGSVVKNLPANAGDAGDAGSISRSERFPGGGNGNPLEYSCLRKPINRGAWWATVHEVARVQHNLVAGHTPWMLALRVSWRIHKENYDQFTVSHFPLFLLLQWGKYIIGSCYLCLKIICFLTQVFKLGGVSFQFFGCWVSKVIHSHTG